jgi:hypothetical protein
VGSRSSSSSSINVGSASVNSSTCKTLEDVLAWAHATGGSLLEVIVQDEYTHDVIVGMSHDFVVFDST